MMRIMQTFLCAALLAASMPAMAQASWAVTKTMHIGGDGSWDYVTVDSQTHRVFVTRSTHTMVIDGAKGKVLGDIPGQIRSHGTAIVPALHRGFITDGGGDGSIVVFDLKTYAVLGKLKTMPDSDGIIYDPGTNLVLAVSGDKGKLMTFRPDIDPQKGTIDPPIDLGGAPEFLAADGEGKAYVNIEDKDVVAVVDLKTRQVTARWPVAPGGHPVGMAFDPRNHLLIIGCRNPQRMVLMSTADGKVVADFPIGAGVDATGIDNGQVFASGRDGSLTVVGEKDGMYAVQQTVKTPEGARTMGVDPIAGKIYLPTAEFEAAAPGAAPSRPKMKAGTFMIVVLGQE